jgi:NAD/NADP transhydrogenase beta subunit
LVVSTWLIVWLAVAVFVLQSVAVQVRVTEIPQVKALVTSTCVRLGLESHVSVACGLLNAVVGSIGHSTVPFGPTPVITGLVVSTWLIVWLAVAVFVLQSVAVQVRVTEIPQVKALVTST